MVILGMDSADFASVSVHETLARGRNERIWLLSAVRMEANLRSPLLDGSFPFFL